MSRALAVALIASAIALVACSTARPTASADEPPDREAAPTVAAPPLEARAAELGAALVSGELAAFEPVFGVWPVTVTTSHSLGEDADDETVTLADARAFATWLSTQAPLFACPDRPGAAPEDDCLWYNGLVVGAKVECGADGCCAFDAEDMSHNTLYLERLCFADAASAAPRLQRVELLDGD